MNQTARPLRPDGEEAGISLRVAEALPRDVGRGLARLDPADMEQLQCRVGDIVIIEGKRSTVAKVAPTYQEYRGKKSVQIDGILRENAKVGIDDKVRLSKTVAEPARSIQLKRVSADISARPIRAPDQYWRRILEGIPVTKGDKVRAQLFGSKARHFEVVATVPGGAVIISPSTQINIQGESGKEASSEKRPTVSYEDVGGLTKEIQRIREMVELPLKHPEVFEHLGIEPPKGVLLYGPPGTGKTLIARAVAHESEANFYTVNGPEIVHKFYGESEAHLRSIFEEARKNAPAILFIDEIDSVGPKRATVQGEVEKRIVATLLSLMDGLESRGQLIVIGATNMPDLLDAALRRPGRFDREIYIGIPDRNSRFQIFEIHTRGMPLAENVDLAKIADITHGYVGADIEAVAREAAMACLREVMESGSIRLDEVPDELVAGLEVNQTHFLHAMNEVDPSGIREVSIEIPNVRWSDIGGLSEVQRILVESIEWPIRYEALFRRANLKPTKGVLLSGPPGCGKTLIAKALATESEVNFISIKGPELVSKYVGDTEKGVREVFKKAKAAAPCILFFDEIDSMAAHRQGGGNDSGVMGRTISQFLTELDGLEELRGVIVLGATNRLDMLDPALIRPGRFDHIVELQSPDQKDRVEIFKIHTRGKPIDKDIDLQKLAAQTDGCNGAEIESICRRAATLAVHDFVEQYKEKSNDHAEKLVVKKEHFTAVMKSGRKESM